MPNAKKPSNLKLPTKENSPPGVRGPGRPAGAVNKLKKEIASDAREYAEKALKVLSEIMTDKGAPSASRVQAANVLLDRGYGKAPQALHLGQDEDARPLVHQIQLVPIFSADDASDHLLDPPPDRGTIEDKSE